MHEASLYERNCVVTLTYDNRHLPVDGSLVRDEFPRFVRRLRKRGAKVRYFHCGEYGDDLLRPHYHGCLFGHDFSDKLRCEPSRSGAPQFVSAQLDRVWGQGIAKIGELNFESAAYIARYVTKKVLGRAAEGHYSRVDYTTGEVVQVEPEFATMSRRPGIGAGWFEQFKNEVYPSDEVIVRARPCRPPRYYDERLSEEELSALKARRLRDGMRSIGDRSKARLRVREVCTEARLNLFGGRNL